MSEQQDSIREPRGTFHVGSLPVAGTGVRCGEWFLCQVPGILYEGAASGLKYLLSAFIFFFLYKESEPQPPCAVVPWVRLE